MVYYDVMPNSRLEEYSKEYSRLLESHGEDPLSVRRLKNVEDVLKEADVSSACLTDNVAKLLHNQGCAFFSRSHVELPRIFVA